MLTADAGMESYVYLFPFSGSGPHNYCITQYVLQQNLQIKIFDLKMNCKVKLIRRVTQRIFSYESIQFQIVL